MPRPLEENATGANVSDKHLEFHPAIAPASVCATGQVPERLWSRRLMVSNTADAAGRGVPKNRHRKLVRALSSRDRDTAEKSMREHVRSHVQEQLAARARQQRPRGLPTAGITAKTRRPNRRMSA